MNRVAKQLIYGAVYLLLILTISLSVYLAWFRKTSTCFDNIQNQREMGVDCGGPCVSCAIKNLKIDTSVSPISLQAGQDQSVVFATLKDDSSDYGVRFSYNLIVYSIIGEQLDSRTGVSSILPNDSRYLVFTGIPSSAKEVGRIVLNTSNITWVPSVDMVRYDLSIKSVNTHIDQNGKFSRPFVMPQKDPLFYNSFKDNYNVPELIKGAVTINKSRLLKVARSKSTPVNVDKNVDVDGLSGASKIEKSVLH